MSPGEELILRVREIVAHVVELDLGPDDDILRSGRLDSLGLIELIAAIEQELGVSVSLADLDIEDFRTVRSIADFISSPTDAHDGTRTWAAADSCSPSRSMDGESPLAEFERDLELQS